MPPPAPVRERGGGGGGRESVCTYFVRVHMYSEEREHCRRGGSTQTHTRFNLCWHAHTHTQPHTQPHTSTRTDSTTRSYEAQVIYIYKYICNGTYPGTTTVSLLTNKTKKKTEIKNKNTCAYPSTTWQAFSTLCVPYVFLLIIIIKIQTKIKIPGYHLAGSFCPAPHSTLNACMQ